MSRLSVEVAIIPPAEDGGLPPPAAAGYGDGDHDPFNKDHHLKRYGAQSRRVEHLALLSAALFSLNWFLGVCTLTWASAVILGGLLPQLNCADFFCIAFLLPLEALRVASATFFGNLVTRKLIYRSTHPSLIKYNDKDKHLILAIARFVDQAFQLLVLPISIFLPLKRLNSLRHDDQPSQNNTNFDSLYHSLRIFYRLVLLNAAIAVMGVLHSKILVPRFATSFSLLRYYDHLVLQGMEKGFLYVIDFDFLEFPFKALADEYRRNLRASVVYEHYQDLIMYLYAHNGGFDVARIAMDSSDHGEQLAAANIVGLWAKYPGVGPSLLLQSRLLTKLADTLDHQETGRAASCSFESLARLDPEGWLLEVENGRGERLMVILSKCIGRAVRAKKEDKALVFIKVLIQLLRSELGLQEAKTTGGEIIVKDLKSVFTARRCKKRTVGVAGKALKLMQAKPSDDEVDESLRKPLPVSDDEHILEDEEEYIKDLLCADGLPLTWGQRAKVRLNTSPTTTPSSTNNTTCLMGLLFSVPIVLSVILCLHIIVITAQSCSIW